MQRRYFCVTTLQVKFMPLNIQKKHIFAWQRIALFCFAVKQVATQNYEFESSVREKSSLKNRVMP